MRYCFFLIFLFVTLSTISQGKKPIDMFGEEVVIYDMIVGRILEAFSARCVKDVSTITAACEDVKFILKRFGRLYSM